jgi:hypothetical protein
MPTLPPAAAFTAQCRSMPRPCVLADASRRGGGALSTVIVRSQQVSWWAVHEFGSAVLRQVNGWPMAGTPAWCALDDEDPAKLAALFDAARHWALRVETCQAAAAEASRAVAASADWPAIARQIHQRRNSARIPRRTVTK